MRLLAALAIAIPLAGCALFQKEQISKKQLATCTSAPKDLIATCNAAVDILNKSNILLASINDGIDKAAFTDKTMAVADARSYRVKTKDADAKLDKIADAITKANYADALSQANVTKLLIEALNREVVAQIAKGAK